VGKYAGVCAFLSRRFEFEKITRQDLVDHACGRVRMLLERLRPSLPRPNKQEAAADIDRFCRAARDLLREATGLKSGRPQKNRKRNRKWWTLHTGEGFSFKKIADGVGGGAAGTWA
jgi:hypothetical protein